MSFASNGQEWMVGDTRNRSARIPCSPLCPLFSCSIYWKADPCGLNSVKPLRGLSFWLPAGSGQGEAPAGFKSEYLSGGPLPGRGCVLLPRAAAPAGQPPPWSQLSSLPFRHRGGTGFLQGELPGSLPGGSPARIPVKDPLVEGSSVSFEHTIRFLIGHQLIQKWHGPSLQSLALNTSDFVGQISSVQRSRAGQRCFLDSPGSKEPRPHCPLVVRTSGELSALWAPALC